MTGHVVDPGPGTWPGSLAREPGPGSWPGRGSGPLCIADGSARAPARQADDSHAGSEKRRRSRAGSGPVQPRSSYGSRPRRAQATSSESSSFFGVALYPYARLMRLSHPSRRQVARCPLPECLLHRVARVRQGGGEGPAPALNAFKPSRIIGCPGSMDHRSAAVQHQRPRPVRSQPCGL